MGEDSGGGKSTQVQAPQRSAAPVRTGTSGGGFIRGQKKSKGMTAEDAAKMMFKNEAPVVANHGSSAGAPKNPYPLLHRNDPCGCKSGRKYKKCCLK
jgi:hypothetical protein